MALEGGARCQRVLLHDIHNANILLLVQNHPYVVHTMEFIRNCGLVVEHAVPIDIEQHLGLPLHSVVLYHYCVQLLFQVVRAENVVAEALFGRPSDVRIKLNEILEDGLKSLWHSIQSIHEVV